jgi:osmotically inducible lipoprotein OsmB
LILCHHLRDDNAGVKSMRNSLARSAVHFTLLAGLALGLAGCGYSTGDRAASGGLIGAGGGAAIAAMTGGAPLVGALIGGAAGAAGGALTSGHTLNLGQPIWR